MAQLIVLGSSNAIPSVGHENSHLALNCGERTVLIDCATNPVVRLELAGLDVMSISDIILTHFHPDHVSGLPLFLMDMWLMGRHNSLNIHGLDYTIDRVEKLMDLYGWDEWPNFFPVNFHRIPVTDLAIVLDDENMRIYASPVKHFLPNIGLRIELKNENKSVAYSCDTEPCQAIIELSRGVDILLHEASGPFAGHSSAAQAGDAARMAEVGALYLIHYPTGKFAKGDPAEEARTYFQGKVITATDFLKIDL